MYLWDVNALVEDFKEKRVSQRERLKYFLVFMGLCIVEAGGYSFLKDLRRNRIKFLAGSIL